MFLFRNELRDPNAHEYGRLGQKQYGIDVLGKRNGDPDHYVGVQCRLISTPIKRNKILEDCRSAIQIKAGLKEIIFATTADDDARATDAAVEVEQLLRTDGHDVSVVVYGWGQLQALIALHDDAYTFFNPAVLSTSAEKLLYNTDIDEEFAATVASQVVLQLRASGGLSSLGPDRQGDGSSSDEDPALHARIDTYRDLFKIEGQSPLGRNGLLSLLEKEPLEERPWAKYRILTNLGSVAIDLGRETEAAERFEAAFALRPEDPNAVANLALARTIQGRFEEAMDLARRALATRPSADHAVLYLLQAAARSAWRGEPESLVPPALAGSVAADLGIAEFTRFRGLPRWPERSLQLCRLHPDEVEFNRIRALSVLAIAVESGRKFSSPLAPVSGEDIGRAADELKVTAEHCLAVGFADQHDLLAYVNNAALILRVSGRHAEAEDLITKAIPQLGQYASRLFVLLALTRIALGRRQEALRDLGETEDPEAMLLTAELLAIDDPRSALDRAWAIEPANLDPEASWLRWHVIGETAFRTGDADRLNAAIKGLRAISPDDPSAEIFEIRSARRTGSGDNEAFDRYRALASTLPPDSPVSTRYIVADELRDQGLPSEAADVLEAVVDLTRLAPATILYLQSLAAARRDEAFRSALQASTAEVREDSDVLWTTAAHAWNIGDLPAAEASLLTLLKKEPNNADARLLRIELLARQNRSTELLTELNEPIERLAWRRLSDRFRVVSFLGYFGFIDRAAWLAYRLFLENRDDPRAWMTLISVILDPGNHTGMKDDRWAAEAVGPDIAVDLRYDDGGELFFVVEPDSDLRRVDNQSWEQDHRLIRSLAGLQVGSQFEDPSGRRGAIVQLRHKYVARLHFAMENYQHRFPDAGGLQKISIDPERPGGSDELIAQVKARHDWVAEEQRLYTHGPWPIAMLAHRTGVDPIEVAIGLNAQHIPLKVAVGQEGERVSAARAIRRNAQAGCALDLLTFWTAWRVGVLGCVESTCGKIHLPQSVLDRLSARRERMNGSAHDGLMTGSYESGRLVIHQVSAEVIREYRDDLDAAIFWAHQNAIISPVMARENLTPEFRDLLRSGRSDMFDAVVLAESERLLLVSDDLPSRQLSAGLSGRDGSWLQQVLSVGLEQKRIDLSNYVQWCVELIRAGQTYIGVSSRVLAQSILLDAESGTAPGLLFETLASVIGGRRAEPLSHIENTVEFLRFLWSDPSTELFRGRAASLLITCLIRDRQDYGAILRSVLMKLAYVPAAQNYIRGWIKGHFLAEVLQ